MDVKTAAAIFETAHTLLYAMYYDDEYGEEFAYGIEVLNEMSALSKRLYEYGQDCLDTILKDKYSELLLQHAVDAVMAVKPTEDVKKFAFAMSKRNVDHFPLPNEILKAA